MEPELNSKHLFWIVFLIGLSVIITLLISPIKHNINSKNVEQTRYCHIDTITACHNQLTPEITTSYHTDCGFTINSKDEYKIGDSIPVKTIYFLK